MPWGVPIAQSSPWPDTHCSIMKRELTHGNSTANFEIMLMPQGLLWSDALVILYTTLQVSHEKWCGFLWKGALLSTHRQRRQVEIPVAMPAASDGADVLSPAAASISVTWPSSQPGLAQYGAEDVTSAMWDFRLGFHIFLLRKSLSLQNTTTAPKTALSCHFSNSEIYYSSGYFKKTTPPFFLFTDGHDDTFLLNN